MYGLAGIKCETLLGRNKEDGSVRMLLELIRSKARRDWVNGLIVEGVEIVVAAVLGSWLNRNNRLQERRG